MLLQLVIVAFVVGLIVLVASDVSAPTPTTPPTTPVGEYHQALAIFELSPDFTSSPSTASLEVYLGYNHATQNVVVDARLAAFLLVFVAITLCDVHEFGWVARLKLRLLCTSK